MDNHLYSFARDLDNGIPILPFYEDKSDDQLHRLTSLLLHLHSEPDVSRYLKSQLGLPSLSLEGSLPEIVKQFCRG